MSRQQRNEFVKMVSDALRDRNMIAPNIQAFISENNLWVKGDYTASKQKLKEYLNPVQPAEPVRISSTRAKRARAKILKRYEEERTKQLNEDLSQEQTTALVPVSKAKKSSLSKLYKMLGTEMRLTEPQIQQMNIDLLNIYKILDNEKKLNRPQKLEMLRYMANLNALKELYPQNLPDEIMQYLKYDNIDEHIKPKPKPKQTLRIEEIKDDEPQKPPYIPPAPPINAPLLSRLVNDDNKHDDNKPDKTKDKEFCDCPFGEYNKCKHSKPRPDDFMFEKTEDGKKYDLGRTIVNVYCGATGQKHVPKELADHALEVNKAPQEVKQQIAKDLSQTIKKIDTKTSEPPPSTQKGALGFSPADLIKSFKSLKKAPQKEEKKEEEQTELKKVVLKKTAPKVEKKDDTFALRALQNIRTQVQPEPEEKYPDVSEFDDKGKGYYKKKRIYKKKKLPYYNI